MRVLVLTADYNAYLNWLYARNPGLTTASYAQQVKVRAESLFGVADFYSRSFRAFGHEASEIFVNNPWIQSAWAREHGLRIEVPQMPALQSSPTTGLIMRAKRVLSPYRDRLAPIAKRLRLLPSMQPALREILLAQIEQMRPDVILNQEVENVGSDIMRAVKLPGRILIAQCGVQPPADLDLSPYDFGISLIPWVVDFYRGKGLPGEHCHLAFDPVVLERLGPTPKKDIEVSFVGGLASNHAKRIAILEAIARRFPIQLWLSNFKGISGTSPLHACNRGEVWGSEMYDVLRRSKITLNTHIDAARGMAGNMRLYEATGVGTFLLTDNLANLPTLFAPGIHVGAFDSVEDCLKKIEYYLREDELRERIARAGQMHTLEHHTYRQRIEELLRLIGKYSK
jgi:spore maturation protein CgeB